MATNAGANSHSYPVLGLTTTDPFGLLKIKGDKMTAEQFRSFLADVFTCYRTVVKNGASMYACHPSSGRREFQDALELAGFEIRCQAIWAKNTFAWGFGRYKFQHEPIFYCHVAGQSDLGAATNRGARSGMRTSRLQIACTRP